MSPSDDAAQWKRFGEWRVKIAEAEAEGIKTEAAVAEIIAAEGVSRAAVFDGIKRHREYMARIKEFGDRLGRLERGPDQTRKD